MYASDAQELAEIDRALAEMDEPKRQPRVLRLVIPPIEKHERVNLSAPIETLSEPKTPLLPKEVGASEPTYDRDALIDGVSNTAPYPSPSIPLNPHPHHHASSTLDQDHGGEIGIDEGAKRLSKTDRTATASRSDAKLSPASMISKWIDKWRIHCWKTAWESKHGAIQLRLPDRIPRKPSCDRARTHRTQPRFEELPPVERLRRTNYSLSFQASKGLTHVKFTLDLNHRIEKLASAQEKPLDYLYRRLRHELGDLCNLFVITAEVAPVTNGSEIIRRHHQGLPHPKWRLHLHGELVCRPKALGARWRRQPKFWQSTGSGATVYNAMIKAAGAWDDPAYQLDFEANPGHRWLADYAVKNGIHFCMTGDLRRLVKTDYLSSREMANGTIKRVTRKRRDGGLSKKSILTVVYI